MLPAAQALVRLLCSHFVFRLLHSQGKIDLDFAIECENTDVIALLCRVVAPSSNLSYKFICALLEAIPVANSDEEGI